MSHSRNIVLCLFGAMTLLLSCSKPWQTDSFRNTTEENTYSLYDLYIDEHGNKGIVAWKYYYKWKNAIEEDYMLVISLDEAYLPWGPMGERVYLSDSVSYTTGRFGMAMLNSMYSRGIERYPAMNWCYQRNDDQHPHSGSWRLPSEIEWYRMMNTDEPIHLQMLNQALKKYGGTPIDEDAMYWMAEEDYEGLIEFDNVESDYDPYNRAAAANTEIKFWANKDRWIKKIYNNVRAVKLVIFIYD